MSNRRHWHLLEMRTFITKEKNGLPENEGESEKPQTADM